MVRSKENAGKDVSKNINAFRALAETVGWLILVKTG